ncbi:uncharacterized protein [Neodiprion pinetum]|uniref:Uncharacterized protein LOC107220783 n=1 Tax=Neodiprion lecontei TaxID=441921 RepID=A0A6J0BMF8_NEOLC|nr:uncharacterized protein LOC107220783 [Neodiprion lecontei]XP_046465419.1 uncharacterized protein LOC124210961 [Neodiprion pinetum]XP_046603821.1 uncharacterized protein LOC124297157 [Neodiprion virginianus]
MQDRMFDMVDINEEIERAKSTLEAADFAFQRHATKFDNNEIFEDATLVKKTNRHRNLQDVEVEEKPRPKAAFKWAKVSEMEEDPTQLKSITARKARINSLIAENTNADFPFEGPAIKIKPKSAFKSDKRKKTVSF